MAIIVIKDLPDSVDLDRRAMVAITGGARMGARQTFAGRSVSPRARIINYPTTLAFDPQADANRRPAGSAPHK